MSIDDTIKASLEGSVQPVEDPGAVIAEVEWRQVRQRRRRTGTRLLVAAACVIVIGVGALVASMPGSNSSSDRVIAEHPDAAPGTSEDQPLGTLPTVTAFTSNLGPLRVTTSDLSDAEHGWLEHTVTIENTGTETVYVNDHRTGQFLGDREVLAGDEGCGHGGAPGEPVGIVCYQDYRPLTLEPGEASALHITLWRDLAGMNAVTSGTFVFRKTIVYSAAPFLQHDQSGTEGELVLTYERLDRPGDPEARHDSEPSDLKALAEHLLGTSDVERVVEGLTAGSYEPSRDYAVLEAAQLVGLARGARAGVARQWSRAYSWAAGDPVPDLVVSVASTILEFDDPGQAQEAAEAIRSLAGDGVPITGLPAGFVAHGPPQGADGGAGLRSWVAWRVQGNHFITVQLDAVGEEVQSRDFRALVQSAAGKANTLGR